MKKFKSKYPKDSNEYLVSYLINITFNRKGYDTIYKFEDLDKINLDELSYVQRVIFINDMLIHKLIKLFKDRNNVEKLTKELNYLKTLNRNLFGKDISAINFDEENDIILQEDGGKININEFLKNV